MSVKKNAAATLDQQVTDWEASVKRASFHVPAGTYIADLVGGGLEVSRDGKGVSGQLIFVSSSPIEGLQIRLNQWLSAPNKEDVNWAIGALLDSVDLVRATGGMKFVDRQAISTGGALQAVVDELVESRVKNVTVIAHVPEKNTTTGKTYQQIEIGLPASAGKPASAPSIDGDSAPTLKKGGKVKFEDEEWAVSSVSEEGLVTIKRGRRFAEVSADQLIAL